MQRLVRTKATGQFLTPDWTWTPHVAQAWRFRDIAQAIGIASQLETIEVEVVLMYGDAPSDHDLSLSMKSRRPR